MGAETALDIVLGVVLIVGTVAVEIVENRRHHNDQRRDAGPRLGESIGP